MWLTFLTLLRQDLIPFDPSVHEARRVFAYDEFRLVPVRVHLLRSPRVDSLNSRLGREDVERIFSKVRRIWHKAGITLDLESVVEEEARDEGFDPSRGVEAWKDARPEASKADGLLHVYYARTLPMNGVYMGRDAIFVKDTAALRPAKGGTDEPLPRVTSHEIGHALGLPHRQDEINLMASGTSGWSLNDDEIERARRTAASFDWILKPAAALERKRYAALLEIPGDSPVKDAARAAR